MHSLGASGLLQHTSLSFQELNWDSLGHLVKSAAGVLLWAEHVQLRWQEVKSVKVQRFYRPEDISKDLGYRSGFWDIYASPEQEEVDVGDIQHMCQVQRSGSPAGWYTVRRVCKL